MCLYSNKADAFLSKKCLGSFVGRSGASPDLVYKLSINCCLPSQVPVRCPGCTNFMQPLSACEGRRSPLFQYDTGCRPNFTCRTFTALSVLLQYQPLLTRGTTFLCDRRVRTLSCAMERVPKSRCAMRSARTYRGPHFCKAFRPLLSVYSIRGFEREPLLQRF